MFEVWKKCKAAIIAKGCVFILSLIFCTFAQAKTEIYFSPSTDCENKLVGLIENAQSSIDAAVYSINNDNIVEALKKAHDRGIKIRLLTDKLQARGKTSKVYELYQYGLDVKVNSKFKIEHNKFAVFDGMSASSGSYNWTNPASEKNSENCIFFVQDKKIAEVYQNRFDELWLKNSKEKSDIWFRQKFSWLPILYPTF